MASREGRCYKGTHRLGLVLGAVVLQKQARWQWRSCLGLAVAYSTRSNLQTMEAVVAQVHWCSE